MPTSPVSRPGHLARCLMIAGVALAGLVPQAALATERYMALALPFFEPYRVAIATLEVQGGKVSGTLAPPAGDPRAPLPLSGTLADGALRLTIGQGNDTYTLAFSENQRGLHHIFEEAASIPGLDAVSLFRPEDGFSAAALALQHDSDNWCGRVYGGLTLTLRAAELVRTPAAPAALAELDVVVTPQQGGAVKAKLKDVWSRLRLAARDNEDVSFDVAVPLGSEVRTAQELRRMPQVAAVMLPSLCGEMALVVVSRPKIADGDTVSEAKLKAYGDAMLSRLLSGAPPEATIPGQRKFKLAGAVVPGEAGPAYKATITAEAEATRLGRGNWDQFTLLLQPVVTATDTGASISLIPAVSDLRTAKKTGPQPPADNTFRAVDDSAVVATIAQRLVSYIADAEGSRCAFLTQADFEEPDGAISCANLALDDVTHPDDN
ncbi:hypothetical protein ABLE93_01210 [Xanthobacter sp. KR7-65]|uniref:hypothetical protein n=1 Tax=Xanthobacter sp. KR7-65 TaxID=3156612 RepID=UPI0032B4DDF3